MSTENKAKKPDTGAATSTPRGEKAFALFDYALKVVKVTIVVLGIMIVIIALSGVDMARLDEHEIFRYRMIAAPAVIGGYLLFDYLLGRGRARREAEIAATRSTPVVAADEFVLSVDLDADRRAAAAATEAASTSSQIRPKRSFAAELMALGFAAAGVAAFWHDHMTQDIPNPVAVIGKFVSATCVEQSLRGAGVRVVVGPHMSIGYEFPSQATQPRTAQIECLLEKCIQEKTSSQLLDTEYNRIFYSSLQACQAALPTVLALKVPVTVWTGDKDLNAAVRARFTAERSEPPYFLIWFPAIVAAVVLLVSGFLRRKN